MALNGLLCADVLLRTHTLTHVQNKGSKACSLFVGAISHTIAEVIRLCVSANLTWNVHVRGCHVPSPSTRSSEN